MRVECHYIVEGPGALANGPSAYWPSAAGAVMRSSVSGLLRYVNENNSESSQNAAHQALVADKRDRPCPSRASSSRAADHPKSPTIPPMALTDMLHAEEQRGAKSRDSFDVEFRLRSLPVLEKASSPGGRTENTAAPESRLEELFGESAVVATKETPNSGFSLGAEADGEGDRVTTAGAGDGAEQQNNESAQFVSESTQGVSADNLFVATPVKRSQPPFSTLAALSFPVAFEEKESLPCREEERHAAVAASTPPRRERSVEAAEESGSGASGKEAGEERKGCLSSQERPPSPLPSRLGRKMEKPLPPEEKGEGQQGSNFIGDGEQRSDRGFDKEEGGKGIDPNREGGSSEDRERSKERDFSRERGLKEEAWQAEHRDVVDGEESSEGSRPTKVSEFNREEGRSEVRDGNREKDFSRDESRDSSGDRDRSKEADFSKEAEATRGFSEGRPEASAAFSGIEKNFRREREDTREKGVEASKEPGSKWGRDTGLSRSSDRIEI